MARPIEITQPLYGEDAEHFLEQMNKPLTKEEIAHAKELEEMFKDHDPFADVYDDAYEDQEKEE